MTNYLVDKITFSYSSLSSFDTCAWGWYLTYIDSSDREPNFFSEFGLLIHNLLEGYWRNYYEKEELVEAYKKLYDGHMKSSPPPYPAGMAGKYYDDGLKFFESFDGGKERFDPIFIEDKVVAEYDGIKIIVKPDLILKDKITGKTYLIDYKTSKPVRNNSWDMKKIEAYEYQLFLYSHFIEETLGIKVDKIALLFVRLGSTYYIRKSKAKTKIVLKWLTKTVEKIKSSETFPANTANKYFCDNLCGVRSSCEFVKSTNPFDE